MQRAINKVLVTGSHRSGTTWVGKVLASAPRTLYIHEPFNVKQPCAETSLRMTYWYQRLSDADGAAPTQAFRDLFALRFPRPRLSLADLRWPLVKRLAGSLGRAVRPPAAVVMKDPLALFSTDWLVRHFEVKPVVMIRHPAAFVSSLKVKRWRCEFGHFLAQPQAIAHFFPEERPAIEAAERAGSGDMVREGALMWRLLHKAILKLRADYPRWLFVRHEDVSRDPHTQFRELFARLSLDFTPRTQAMLESTTSTQDTSYVQRSTGVHNVVRNSEENVDVWKERLTPAEIEEVREIAGDTATAFYAPDEW